VSVSKKEARNKERKEKLGEIERRSAWFCLFFFVFFKRGRKRTRTRRKLQQRVLASLSLSISPFPSASSIWSLSSPFISLLYLKKDFFFLSGSSPASLIVTFLAGDPEGVPCASIFLTTSIPSSTSPKTTCLPSSHEVTTVVMKNCLGGERENGVGKKR
jgi:hypothetical protein